MDSFDILNNPNFGLPSSFNYFSAQNEDEVAPKDLDTFNFKLANMEDPSQFLPQLKASNHPEKKVCDVKQGTTTLAFIYQGGVVVAVDSRASMGHFAASDNVRKVLPISSYMVGTMAGTAADCQFWLHYIETQCRLHELRNGERPTVAMASRMLANIMYQYKGYGLGMGSMMAGWDNTGPHLVYVDNDASRLEGKLFSVGSGSTYAYSVLDAFYKWDLTFEEAVNLGMKAIYHATHRDSASGGVVRVYHITKDGWKIIHDAYPVDSVHWELAHLKKMEGDGDELRNKLI